MDAKTQAEIDLEVAQFKSRLSSLYMQDYSRLEEETAACVFAHAAFAALDYAVAEQMAYIRAQGIAVKYERRDTWFQIAIGANRVVYKLPLDERAIRISYVKRAYPGAQEEVCDALLWPPEIVPLEQLREPIEAFVKTMRAFLMRGKVLG